MTSIDSGTRVWHKTLGFGFVLEYVDFYNTKDRSNILKDSGIVFIQLDEPPQGYAKVVQVDVEALTLTSLS